MKDPGGYIGVTLYPFECKKKQVEKQIQDGISKKDINCCCSINCYNQVIINIWMKPHEIVENIGHEAYGHLIFKVMGKPNHSHNRVRKIGQPGCNDELEIHIIDRQNESLENYAKHNK